MSGLFNIQVVRGDPQPVGCTGHSRVNLSLRLHGCSSCWSHTNALCIHEGPLPWTMHCAGTFTAAPHACACQTHPLLSTPGAALPHPLVGTQRREGEPRASGCCCSRAIGRMVSKQEPGIHMQPVDCQLDSPLLGELSKVLHLCISSCLCMERMITHSSFWGTLKSVDKNSSLRVSPIIHANLLWSRQYKAFLFLLSILSILYVLFIFCPLIIFFTHWPCWKCIVLTGTFGKSSSSFSSSFYCTLIQWRQGGLI